MIAYSGCFPCLSRSKRNKVACQDKQGSRELLITVMTLRAVFLVLSFMLLCLVFIYNKALVSPWKPRLYFVQGMTSKVQGEQQQPWGKETLQSEKAVDHSSLPNSKRRENMADESTRLSRQSRRRKNLIILSPGRGGSSLLGEIFNTSPNVVYWFEPLHTVLLNLFHVQFFNEGKEPTSYKDTTIRVLNSFLQCDFSNIRNSTLSAFSRSPFRWRSKALSRGPLCRSKCAPFSKALLSKACNSYNHTVIKVLTARVPNNTIQTLKELFKQPDQNDLKLVHLVRDPRAVVYSMVYATKWIQNYSHPSFGENIRNLCDPILQNIRFGLISPPSWLQKRFMVIRYEDLVLNTVNIAKELYRFAGFDWSISVHKWIDEHLKNDSMTSKDPYSLKRNATAVIDKWKTHPKPSYQLWKMVVVTS